jgi:hypothetical protein
MRRQRVLALGVAMSLLGVAPAHMLAQQPAREMQQQQMMQQQQQHMMQEQMRQLNQSMERMSQLQARAQNMEWQMTQMMLVFGQDPQLGERSTLQLRNQERIRDMAQAMNEGAVQMHQAMEQLRDMMGEPGVTWDRDMERDMQQLRERWENMPGSMEDGLRIMERLRDQVQDQIHQPDGER